MNMRYTKRDRSGYVIYTIGVHFSQAKNTACYVMILDVAVGIVVSMLA